MTRPGSAVTLSYRTPPAIRWCRDCNRVLVVNEDTCHATSLTGLDAALWQWYCLEYDDQEVVPLVQEFLQVTAEEARDRINQVINHWVEQDLLIIDDNQ